MNIGKILPVILCCFSSVSLTGVTFLYDLRNAEDQTIESLLKWSRQIVHQVESLAAFGKEKQEANPIAWAVKFLTIGDENRLLTVKEFVADSNSSGSETFHLNSKEGEFSYSKVMEPQSKQGIQLQIHAGYRGFLGSRSHGTSDLLVAGLFFLLLITFLSVTIQPKSKREDPVVDLTADEEEALISGIRDNTSQSSDSMPQEKKKIVLDWIQEAKEVLKQLGLHIRDLTQAAKSLAEMTAKSKSSLDQCIGASTLLKEKVGILAEVVGAQVNPEGGAENSEIFELIQKIQEITHQTLGQMEGTSLEYKKVFEVSQTLNETVGRTTDTLLHEAKLMQGLKGKLS